MSVLLYVPVRSASLAPIACRKEIVTEVVGDRCRPGGLREGDLQRLRERERAVGQPARVATTLDSAASPAVEITLAHVDALYSRATPGVNAPNEAAGPMASDSVAATVPPGGPT